MRSEHLIVRHPESQRYEKSCHSGLDPESRGWRRSYWIPLAQEYLSHRSFHLQGARFRRNDDLIHQVRVD